MLRPYVRLLPKYPQLGEQAVAGLRELDPDARVPIAEMLELLRAAVQITGDEDLGLKAASEIASGDYGLIEFLVHSATTMREAVELLARYLRLVNDAVLFSLHIDGDCASIRLDSRIALPRAAVDFQSAAFYVATLQRAKYLIDPDSETCFVHPQPADTEVYRRTFAPGRVRFSAPFNGFAFSARMLDRTLITADASLHGVLHRYADLMIAALPRSDSVSDKVRAVVSQQLSRGEPTVEKAARALHMSRRTLARRLEREGTSFKALLDDTRRSLALAYLTERQISSTEVAYLLGFAHTGAFARAFKRWTGSSPRDYRRARRHG
jgi:AraC-like DNA-binding protein